MQNFFKLLFVFSSNRWVYFSQQNSTRWYFRKEINLDEFPSPETLWNMWTKNLGLDEEQNTF